MWKNGSECEMGLNVDLKNGAGQKFYSEEFEALMESYNNPSPELDKLFTDLGELIYLQILRAFYECGWVPKLGQTQELDVLSKQFEAQPKLNNYFKFMLKTLAEEGILEREKNGTSWKVINIPQYFEKVKISLESPQFSIDLVEKFSPAAIIRKLGQNLSGILRGEVSALKILFAKDENGSPEIRDFYCSYPKVFRFSESFCLANRQRLAQLRNSMNGQRFILRVLEVGAGTGGYSAQFLKCLEEEDIEFEYTYTDISSAFFPAAKKRFEKYSSVMKYKKLNIEEDPIQQGFTPEYFDFVYMAEVIHATRNIRESLKNIRMLMKPYARMDMHEGTRENRIITYIFGALEGFWRYEDFDLRQNHCILSPQKWAAVLEETGFKIDRIFPVHNNYHSHVWVHKTATEDV